MFIAGLETDLDQLRRNWKPAVAVAVGGIILPLICGFGVGKPLDSRCMKAGF
nr:MULTISPECIES: cation:proton antiporter [Paenibacillus]